VGIKYMELRGTAHIFICDMLYHRNGKVRPLPSLRCAVITFTTIKMQFVGTVIAVPVLKGHQYQTVQRHVNGTTRNHYRFMHYIPKRDRVASERWEDINKGR